MKKSILIIAAAIAIFTSCKKEEDSTVTPVATETVTDYFPLKIGNYWVYEQIQADSAGNVIPQSWGPDSMIIKGDSIINGKTYFTAYEYNWLGSASPRIKFFRDSSGYIVNEDGFVLLTLDPNYSYTHILSADTIAYVDYSYIGQPENVTVPFGTFSCVDYRGQMYRKQDNYTVQYLTHNYYSKGTGKVKTEYRFVNSLGYIYLNLLRYHIEP